MILSENDRILIKNQTNNPTENGIYIIKTNGNAPIRSTDFAFPQHVAGAFMFIEEGDINADTGWLCVNDTGSDIVETNNLEFVQFSRTAEINAGTGLTKDGTTLNINSDLSHITRVGLLNSLSVTGDVMINTTSLQLNNEFLTSSASELNLVNGSSSNTIINNKAVIYGSTGEVNASTFIIGSKIITESKIEFLENLNKNDTLIYCDSNRSDSYTENGSVAYPYKTLSQAVIDKTTDNDTTSYTFILTSGNYDNSISITKTTANQKISIIGYDRESTYIRGSSTWDNTVSSVLFLRNFASVTLENVTIQNGTYGFYPRDCDYIRIQNCKFIYCGSSGLLAMHDGSETVSLEQAKYMWNSGDTLAINTSDGGAMRIRACNNVYINNNIVTYCFRGFRIQDCILGLIQNNYVYRILDNGIYLAAESYTGSDGCENIVIHSNTITEAGHHGMVCIGGKNNTFKNNIIIKSWATVFNTFHTRNVEFISNTCTGNNWKAFNGYGVDTEHVSQLYLSGGTHINDGALFLANIQNNNFIECGEGNVNKKVMLKISLFVTDFSVTDTQKLYLVDNRFDGLESNKLELTDSNWLDNIVTMSTGIDFTSATMKGDIIPDNTTTHNIGTTTNRIAAVHTTALGFGSSLVTLPTSDGTEGQVLKTDGSGALSWETVGGVSEINDLSDCLVKNDSMWVGSNPSPTTTTVSNYINAPTPLDAACIDPSNPHQIFFFKFPNWEIWNIDTQTQVQASQPIINTFIGTNSKVSSIFRGSHLGTNLAGEDLFHQILIYEEDGGFTRYQASNNYSTNLNDTFWHGSDPNRDFNAEGLSDMADRIKWKNGTYGTTAGWIAYGGFGQPFEGLPHDIQACVVDRVNGKVLCWKDNSVWNVNVSTTSIVSEQYYSVVAPPDVAQYNVAFGKNALDVSTTGNCNVAVGYNSLTASTAGSNNVGVGHESLSTTTSSQYNVGVGSYSLRNLTSGNNNVAIGYDSLKGVTSSGSNVAVGFKALLTLTGTSNEGWNCTAVGSYALQNSIGGYNDAFGHLALERNTTGTRNTAIGMHAIRFNTQGSSNVSIGHNSGGEDSNKLQTGSSNVFIGVNARPNSSSANNQIVIGSNTIGQGNNYAVIGNTDITRLYAAQDGEAVLYANATIQSSDRRLKTDIHASTVGLEFVNDLKPVEFKWIKKKEKNTKKYGLIAQDLLETMNKHKIMSEEYSLVDLDESTDRYGVDYSQLIMPLINSVKELNIENQKLKEQNNSLQNQINIILQKLNIN